MSDGGEYVYRNPAEKFIRFLITVICIVMTSLIVAIVYDKVTDKLSPNYQLDETVQTSDKTTNVNVVISSQVSGSEDYGLEIGELRKTILDLKSTIEGYEADTDTAHEIEDARGNDLVSNQHNELVAIDDYVVKTIVAEVSQLITNNQKPDLVDNLDTGSKVVGIEHVPDVNWESFGTDLLFPTIEGGLVMLGDLENPPNVPPKMGYGWRKVTIPRLAGPLSRAAMKGNLWSLVKVKELSTTVSQEVVKIEASRVTTSRKNKENNQEITTEMVTEELFNELTSTEGEPKLESKSIKVPNPPRILH